MNFPIIIVIHPMEGHGVAQSGHLVWHYMFICWNVSLALSRFYHRRLAYCDIIREWLWTFHCSLSVCCFLLWTVNWEYVHTFITFLIIFFHIHCSDRCKISTIASSIHMQDVVSTASHNIINWRNRDTFSSLSAAKKNKIPPSVVHLRKYI